MTEGSLETQCLLTKSKDNQLASGLHDVGSAILTRQALNLLEGVYPLVKQACRNTSVPLFVDSKDLIHDFTLSLASFSRYESDRDAFGLS